MVKAESLVKEKEIIQLAVWEEYKERPCTGASNSLQSNLFKSYFTFFSFILYTEV